MQASTDSFQFIYFVLKPIIYFKNENDGLSQKKYKKNVKQK